jgi:hypothetical protein
MRRRLPTIIFVALVLISCGSKEEVKPSEVEIEILSLQSIKAKRDYLENIFKDDQKFRSEKTSEILLKYGYESKEYKTHQELFTKQDEENLNKIETYLYSYGNPKKNEVGEIAAITPWAVIHHSSGYEARERNFHFLHEAFLNGDIDEGAFSMFLGRMYKIKNGERYKMQRPYTVKDEIEKLIEKLDLTRK